VRDTRTDRTFICIKVTGDRARERGGEGEGEGEGERERGYLNLRYLSDRFIRVNIHAYLFKLNILSCSSAPLQLSSQSSLLEKVHYPRIGAKNALAFKPARFNREIRRAGTFRHTVTRDNVRSRSYTVSRISNISDAYPPRVMAKDGSPMSGTIGDSPIRTRERYGSTSSSAAESARFSRSERRRDGIKIQWLTQCERS